jgi:hypothetical protein
VAKNYSAEFGSGQNYETHPEKFRSRKQSEIFHNKPNNLIFKFRVFYIGLTHNENAYPRDTYIFSIAFDYCSINNKKHAFEWPNGAIKPKSNQKDDVVGCGLLLGPDNKVFIFFTGNGILMGQFLSWKFDIPIV